MLSYRHAEVYLLHLRKWVLPLKMNYNNSVHTAHSQFLAKVLSNAEFVFILNILLALGYSQWISFIHSFTHEYGQPSVRYSLNDVIATFWEGHVSPNKLIGRAKLRHWDSWLELVLFLSCYGDVLWCCLDKGNYLWVIWIVFFVVLWKN